MLGSIFLFLELRSTNKVSGHQRLPGLGNSPAHLQGCSWYETQKVSDMHIVSFGARVAPRDRIWCLHGIQTSNRAQKGVLQQRLGSACASLFFFSVHALFQVFRQLMARKTEFLQAVWAAIGSNILLFWFAAGGRSDTVQETKRCHPAKYRTCNNR